MTSNDARKNWKMIAAGATAVVIVLILLWPKIREALGNLSLGDVVLNMPAPGAVDYPDLYLEINYPPGRDVPDAGGGCGCSSHGQELIDNAMNYFVNGMMDIQDRYLASIMANRPDWALQYWNNSLGYAGSVNTNNLFGGGR